LIWVELTIEQCVQGGGGERIRAIKEGKYNNNKSGEKTVATSGRVETVKEIEKESKSRPPAFLATPLQPGPIHGSGIAHQSTKRANHPDNESNKGKKTRRGRGSKNFGGGSKNGKHHAREKRAGAKISVSAKNDYEKKWIGQR